TQGALVPDRRRGRGLRRRRHAGVRPAGLSWLLPPALGERRVIRSPRRRTRRLNDGVGSTRRSFLARRGGHAFPRRQSGSFALSALAVDARYIKPTLDNAKVVSLSDR